MTLSEVALDELRRRARQADEVLDVHHPAVVLVPGDMPLGGRDRNQGVEVAARSAAAVVVSDQSQVLGAQAVIELGFAGDDGLAGQLASGVVVLVRLRGRPAIEDTEGYSCSFGCSESSPRFWVSSEASDSFGRFSASLFTFQAAVSSLR